MYWLDLFIQTVSNSNRVIRLPNKLLRIHGGNDQMITSRMWMQIMWNKETCLKTVMECSYNDILHQIVTAFYFSQRLSRHSWDNIRDSYSTLQLADCYQKLLTMDWFPSFRKLVEESDFFSLLLFSILISPLSELISPA